MPRIVSTALVFFFATFTIASEIPNVSDRYWTRKYDPYFRKYSKRFFGPAIDWQWFKAQGFAESGYRTVFNCNGHGQQTVFHIHLHLIGERQMTWPPG